MTGGSGGQSLRTRWRSCVPSIGNIRRRRLFGRWPIRTPSQLWRTSHAATFRQSFRTGNASIISVMRAAGFRYGDYENRLLALDRFLQRQPDAAEQPLAVLVQRWAQEAPRLELRQARVRVGRVVARALQRKDPSVITPDWTANLSAKYVGDNDARIFSAPKKFSRCSRPRSLPSPRAPLRPHTLHTMLVLAYAPGCDWARSPGSHR